MQSAKCSLATAVAALAAIFLTGARAAESPQIEGGQIADAAPDASVAPSILEKRRLETEQDEHRRWQEEQRRQEAKEREDHDYNRWRRFIEVGKLWEEAKLAGNLLEALEQQPAEADANRRLGRLATCCSRVWSTHQTTEIKPDTNRTGRT